MKQILKILLPIFALNFLEIKYELDVLNIEDLFFIKKTKKEYTILYADINSWTHDTYILKINPETNEIISDKKLFKDGLDFLIKQDNYIDVYIFPKSILIDRGWKNNTLFFSDYIGRVANTDNNILMAFRRSTSTLFKYDIILYLIKNPYDQISYELTIEQKTNQYEYNLIGLKDCFVFILFYKDNNLINVKKKGDVKIKLLDFDLKVIETMNISFYNYTNIIMFELPESKKYNEFISCVRYSDDNTYMDCRILEYENSYLQFGKAIRIFFKEGYSLANVYISTFDENKIGFFIPSAPYDIYTILQYENKQLSYYNNIMQSPIIGHVYMNSNSIFINTHKGIAILSSSLFKIYLYYLSTICTSKTIFLLPNQFSIFPIEEIVFKGTDKLEFFFYLYR